MADDKSHIQQGQIERANRLRAVIENLKAGRSSNDTPSGAGSLKEQIDQRAEQAEKKGKKKSRAKQRLPSK